MRLAFKRAAKGKTKRKDIARILADLDTHVDILHEILKNEEFQPAKHKKQQINDGFKQKKRYIIKPYYRYEQVVHHAIIQVLAPTDEAIRKDPTLKKVINRGAYQFTCGSVKGRGAHLTSWALFSEGRGRRSEKRCFTGSRAKPDALRRKKK